MNINIYKMLYKIKRVFFYIFCICNDSIKAYFLYKKQKRGDGMGGGGAQLIEGSVYFKYFHQRGEGGKAIY